MIGNIFWLFVFISVVVSVPLPGTYSFLQGCNYQRGYCTNYCPYPQVDIGYYPGECPYYSVSGFPFICCGYGNYNYNNYNNFNLGLYNYLNYRGYYNYNNYYPVNYNNNPGYIGWYWIYIKLLIINDDVYCLLGERMRKNYKYIWFFGFRS